ncbi:hypothetical protein BH11PLA2_BH11PLA2_39720 [soil metagenome]
MTDLRKRLSLGMLSGIFTLLILAAFLGLGFATGWELPKAAELMGQAVSEAKEEWCSEHSVPESICVECGKAVKARDPNKGWCREHGVHECVLCNPELAQLPAAPTNLAELRDLSTRSLAFAPRVENGSKCKLHGRRLQLAGPDVERHLGLEVAKVTRSAITETITAPGEIVADPTRLARVTARLPGTVWRVEKQLGDTVQAGEVLALVDAAEVGQAKADFQQAVSQQEAKRIALANLKQAGDAVTAKVKLEAESAFDTARVRVLAAEQVLANFGLPIAANDLQTLTPAAMAERLQFLGLPYELSHVLKSQTNSNNLLPVVAPRAGIITEIHAVNGERADPAKAMFTLLDSSRVWLNLRIKLEDTPRVRVGLPVTFTLSGEMVTHPGTIAWISPAIDAKTRSVLARVEVDNAMHRISLNTFVTATITLRNEPAAVTVPTSAIHWDGDCHVVFVRDKDYESSDIKVYHVRKVRPAGVANETTEIAAGVLPGEWVATTNSGIFRSELLKNDLGEG